MLLTKQIAKEFYCFDIFFLQLFLAVYTFVLNHLSNKKWKVAGVPGLVSYILFIIRVMRGNYQDL